MSTHHTNQNIFWIKVPALNSALVRYMNLGRRSEDDTREGAVTSKLWKGESRSTGESRRWHPGGTHMI
jgi:hypothetical protein